MKPIEVVISSGSHRHKDILRQVANDLKAIPHGYEVAVSRAMNRAVLAGRTAAVATIREDYELKSSLIKRHLLIERASRENTEAMVAVRGNMLPLVQYKTRPKTDTTGSKRKPVRVTVQKRRGTHVLKDAFVYKGRVLKRLGPKSLPVKEAYGPAIPLIASNDEISDNIVKTMDASFRERLDHEVQYLLAGGSLGRYRKRKSNG